VGHGRHVLRVRAIGPTARSGDDQALRSAATAAASSLPGALPLRAPLTGGERRPNVSTSG